MLCCKHHCACLRCENTASSIFCDNQNCATEEDCSNRAKEHDNFELYRSDTRNIPGDEIAVVRGDDVRSDCMSGSKETICGKIAEVGLRTAATSILTPVHSLCYSYPTQFTLALCFASPTSLV